MATDEGTVTTTSAPDPADASTDQISKQDQHEENTQTKPKKGRHAVLIFSLLLSLGLIALDSNIITTALPTIAKDFSISNSAFSWTGGAILLAQAVFGPFFAKASYVAKFAVPFADKVELGQRYFRSKAYYLRIDRNLYDRQHCLLQKQLGGHAHCRTCRRFPPSSSLGNSSKLSIGNPRSRSWRHQGDGKYHRRRYI